MEGNLKVQHSVIGGNGISSVSKYALSFDKGPENDLKVFYRVR